MPLSPMYGIYLNLKVIVNLFVLFINKSFLSRGAFFEKRPQIN